jgi:hypothetical protein
MSPRLAVHPGRHLAWLMAALILGVLLAACTPPPTPSPTSLVLEPTPTATTETLIPPAGQAGLVVAWVDGGNLVVWREGDSLPRRISAGSAIRPLLSPDGARVVFTRGPQGQALSLWAAGVDGVAERELAGPDLLATEEDIGDFTRQIGQVAWLDARTVLFNTLRVPRGPGPGGGKSDDLWRADVLTGETARLLPDGQGGDFTLSPDGTRLALVTPGRYGETLGLIRAVDVDGQPIADLLRFDAVSTASEYAFYPEPHWLPDSAALRVAIPHADLIYPPAEGETPRTVALWRLTFDAEPDGSRPELETLGTVPATFFGQPRWSADGAWLTYLRQEGAFTENRLTLVLAAGDGSEPTDVVTGSAGELAPPAWAAGGFTYTAGQPGELWRVVPGQPPRRFPAEGEAAYALHWVDDRTAIYATAPAAPFELRLASLDDPLLAAITRVEGGSAGGFPAFDAVRALP